MEVTRGVNQHSVAIHVGANSYLAVKLVGGWVFGVECV